MKLSVLVPSFNRKDYLPRTIASICQITHRPLELIVVDDGSTDGTPFLEAELLSYCDQHKVGFKFIRQSNAGAATARNTALDNSDGDLVQWVDADDTVVPENVDRLLKELTTDPNLDVAYGLVKVVSESGDEEGTMGRAPSGTESDLFDYLWHTMGAVYRRYSLKQVGRWNPELSMPDDWDFSCRVRIASLSYRFVDCIVGNYIKYSSGTLTIRSFNEDKCFNVITAVLSVRSALVKFGKLSQPLQQRCYNRALVHAVELSSNGSKRSEEAYAICDQIGSPNPVIRLIPLALRLLPIRALHHFVFLKLRNR